MTKHPKPAHPVAEKPAPPSAPPVAPPAAAAQDAPAAPVVPPPPAMPRVLTRRDTLLRLQQRIKTADRGLRNSLRHLDPEKLPGAFYALSVTLLDAHLPTSGARREAQEVRWAALMSAMVEAEPFLVAPVVPLGEALAAADTSELRLTRLLEAGDAEIVQIVRQVVALLVHRGQSFNLFDLADLVLSDPSDPRPRQHIARHYYRVKES